MYKDRERRKDRRLPIELYLEVNHMFCQENQVIEGMDAKIEVVNISRSGIGFRSMAVLPMEYYFNARIELEEKNYFFAVVKIIRQNAQGDGGYLYGGEFIGLAPFLADKISTYEASLQNKEGNDCRSLSSKETVRIV